MAAFEEFGVMPELAHSLEKMDWTLPTEIQAEAIPLILGGGDVLMASETGSGKTGAFCIPIVQVVYEQLLDNKKTKPNTEDIDNTRGKVAWTLSPVDRAADVVLNGDLSMVQSKSGNWQGCRTNKGIKIVKGITNFDHRLYYEVHFASQGLARVGWSLSGGSLDLGTDQFGWGYGGTAKKSNNRRFDDYGQPFGEKFDIVGCILDLKLGELSFTKNGRNMGIAFKIFFHKIESQAIFPTVCVKNAGCQVRLGPSPEKNDYKPNNCIWISEAPKELVFEGDMARQGDNSKPGPLAIILEPSRELAKQTFDCLEIFSKNLGINSALLVGGSGDLKDLNDTHIVVSTPGRLSETVKRNQIPLHNIHFFILDEADGLLNQGFQGLIKSIHAQLPKMFASGRRLQTICCSATLHNFEVKKLAHHLMYFPTWIDLKGEDSVPETVHHVVLRIDPRKDFSTDMLGLFKTDGVHEKDRVDAALNNGSKLCRPEELSEAIKVLKFYYTLKAIESLNMDLGIIFCRTKLDCDNLYEFMCWTNNQTKTNKFSCTRLHSSLSQNERIDNLKCFKDGKVRFLICTDVAARGIDVRGIPYVIQVTLPDEKANYIHRIGRVGRADRMGLALSLVATLPEKVWYHTCKRPQQCFNTRLTDQNGCCKWFDEVGMLGEIEEHLKCTIQEIEKDFKLQVDEHDGKVVYGAKRLENTNTYEGHVEQLKAIVNNLSALESKAQTHYVKLYL